MRIIKQLLSGKENAIEFKPIWALYIFFGILGLMILLAWLAKVVFR